MVYFGLEVEKSNTNTNIHPCPFDPHVCLSVLPHCQDRTNKQHIKIAIDRLQQNTSLLNDKNSKKSFALMDFFKLYNVVDIVTNQVINLCEF